MENPRPEKVAVVEEVRERLESSDATLLTEYRGLSVAQLAELRKQLRQVGTEYKVYKNTLVRRAAHELELIDLDDKLTGPTAMAFVKGDAAAAAKALRDYAKANPALVVKGGVLGNRTMSATDTAALADLPPREVVLAQLAGLMAQPMQKFAGLLQALPRNFAYGLKALIDQGGPSASSTTAPSTPETTSESISEPTQEK